MQPDPQQRKRSKAQPTKFVWHARNQNEKLLIIKTKNSLNINKTKEKEYLFESIQ